MSDIIVTNHTALPIHIAMSWRGIAQDHSNSLQPGESYCFNRFYRGRLDFTAVIATKENRFTQNKPILSAGIVKVGTEIATNIDDLTLNPLHDGLAEVTTRQRNNPISLRVRNPNITLNTAILEGAKGVLLPTHFKALYVAHSYRLCVRGADIIGHYDNTRHAFMIREISPLQVHWKNQTRNLSGTEIGLSVYRRPVS